jgi:hypothetical protein
MTVFNARALASLVTVAGNALSRRLTVILNSLVKVMEDDIDDELREAVDEAINALFSSINDPEGLNTLMMLLLDWYALLCIYRQVSELWLGLNFLQGGVLALAICLQSFVRYRNWTLPSIGSTGFASLLPFWTICK